MVDNKVWYDRLSATYHGVAAAACLGREGVDGWIGIAMLDHLGVVYVATATSCIKDCIQIPPMKILSEMEAWERLIEVLRKYFDLV